MSLEVYLWLVPSDSDPIATKLAKVIEGSGSPLFAPHVTLAIFEVSF